MIPQPTTMLFSEINARELSQVSQEYLKTDIETTCKEAHEARNKRTNNNNTNWRSNNDTQQTHTSSYFFVLDRNTTNYGKTNYRRI